MQYLLEDFRAFLAASPTSWHAVREIGNRLAEKEFIPLSLCDAWELEKGKRYFVSRGGSLCAFALPKKGVKKMTILATHTDSPALKVKPQPQVNEENMVLLEVETYGSPLLTSWMNRDLAIAGRIVIKGGEEKLVFFNDSPLFIPQLAIHLDREVNEKGLVLNKQEHLRPIAAVGKYPAYLEHSLKQKILSFDLFLVPMEEPRYLGPASEMLASYRLDNLASVHAALTAIAQAKPSDQLQVALFSDHEEIGSRSDEGAASTFLADVLKRLEIPQKEWAPVPSASLCVSIDVAHAYNPNYASRYDPNHHPLLGKGIVLKYNADYKYTTNALTAARVLQACDKLSLSHQNFACRSDVPCGSTVGPILSSGLGIPAVDIGCPIFSMHSAREVMGIHDHLDMCKLLTHLLQ